MNEEKTGESLTSRDDEPGRFECLRCSISWHAGSVNPAPPGCPNCRRPWDVSPLFVEKP
jgi:hypothetical protein